MPQVACPVALNGSRDDAPQTADEMEGYNPSPAHSASPEQGRGMREKSACHLLSKYKDFIPGPSNALINSSLDEVSNVAPNRILAEPALAPCSATSHCFKTFERTRRTQKNEFGLYKQFRAPEDHPYDPEADLCEMDFCDIDIAASPSPTGPLDPEQYHPFPNRNAFLLGEWQACDENGKGRKGFNRLLEIIGSPDWNPADICGLNWTRINNALAEPFDVNKDDDEWSDESGWKTTTVSIDVPFGAKCLNPGRVPFEVQFRHRPILPVIMEKIMSLRPDDHFHFLPYELRWQPGEAQPDIGVYGEMYTSPAFLKEFERLQVREPSHSRISPEIHRFQGIPSRARLRPSPVHCRAYVWL